MIIKLNILVYIFTCLHLVCSKGDCGADIGYILDQSGSVILPKYGGSWQNWLDMKEFVKNLTSLLFEESSNFRFAVNTFSSHSYIRFNLNKYTTESQYLKAIENIGYNQGGTDTTSGLETMMDTQFTEANGDRTNFTDIFILITDGEPNERVDELPAIIERVHNKSIRFIALGIGNGVKELKMRDWVRDPNCTATPQSPYCLNRTKAKPRSYFHVTDFVELRNVLQDMVNSLCSIYPMTTPPDWDMVSSLCSIYPMTTPPDWEGPSSSAKIINENKLFIIMMLIFVTLSNFSVKF